MTREEFCQGMVACIDNALGASQNVESMLSSGTLECGTTGNKLMEEISQLKNGLESARVAIKVNDFKWIDSILNSELLPAMYNFINDKNELFL